MRAESAGAEAGDAASAASAVGARDAPASPLLARDTGLLRTVRVRQRALQKPSTSPFLRSARLARSAACGGSGAGYGAFAFRTASRASTHGQPEKLTRALLSGQSL